MNENDENKQIENILRKAHLPEPSIELKERITSVIKKVWNQSSQEIPWQIPVRRLITSTAAAVLIISIANFYSNQALESWHPGETQVTREQLPDFEILPDIHYRSFVRHPISSHRKSFTPDASALRNYVERMRKILNEKHQNVSPNGQVFDEGRSRLFPIQPGPDYYS
jgi:hypothetical protein